MPKADKKPKAAAKPKPLYALAPWSCRRAADHMAIEAYVEAAGDWQKVAQVRQTAFIDAEATANFIVRAVNDYEKNRFSIDELMSALELCLECEGISWEAEHDAEIALARSRAAV